MTEVARRPVASCSALPQVDVARQFEPPAVGGEEHAHFRAVRIGRVHLQNNRDFAGVQLHEIADRIDAEQLHETANEMLIELLAVVALQHREDALGRKRLLVLALRAHRVVHVRDAAQHRRKIQMSAGSRHAGSRCRRCRR